MIFLQMEQMDYLIERLDKLEKKFDEKLEKILVQTTRTNGRVGVLEKTVDEHDEKIEQQGNSATYNKGRNNVWWIVLGAACSLVAIGFAAYVGSLFKK